MIARSLRSDLKPCDVRIPFLKPSDLEVTGPNVTVKSRDRREQGVKGIENEKNPPKPFGELCRIESKNRSKSSLVRGAQRSSAEGFSKKNVSRSRLLKTGR